MGKQVDPRSLLGRRFGPVEVLAPLGRGGMGTVYRAKDDLGREVALKVALDPRHRLAGQERFEREGEIAASLDHPGLARVHSAGVVEGIPFMVCELVEGARTLDQACRGAPLLERVRWVAAAARAVGYAHERGVVHRDLKPANVLVDAEGQVKIIDFGVALSARYDTRLTQTGGTVGTPVYMSPEQLQGKKEEITPASDVWSLGVVLYEALTGARPYEGENMVELASALSAGRATPPSVLEASVPGAVEAVCLRALHALPAARYPNGQALADDLDAALAGHKISASGSALATLAGQSPRKAGLVGLAALAALIVVLGGLFQLLGQPGGEAPQAPGAGAQVGEVGGGARTLDVAAAALAANDLEAVAGALRGLGELKGQPGLVELRAALLERGSALVSQSSSGASLDAVFESLGLLNGALAEPPSGELSLAVVERCRALEAAAEQRLGDERVVTLLEGLAAAGFAAPPISGREMIYEFVVDQGKPRHPAFTDRCYRYLRACLQLQLLVLTADFMVLGAEAALPPLRDEAGPCERYLRLGLELGMDRLGGSTPETDARRKAYERLSAFLETVTPEAMGEVAYGNALYHAGRLAEGVDGIQPETLYERALGLTPGNLLLVSDYSSSLLSQAMAESKAGRRKQASERIRQAAALSRRGVELAASDYDEIPSFASLCKGIRLQAVRSAGLVGDRAGAQAIIDTTPRHRWIEDGGFRWQLSEVLEKAFQVHLRVFRGS